MSVAMQDAKALYGALEDLVEALRHVTAHGVAHREDQLHTATQEADVLLQALDGFYTDG